MIVNFQSGIFISIHSLRMEGDTIIIDDAQYLMAFQSTPSVWRETVICGFHNNAVSISIHSLRMEGDRCQTRL